MGEQPPHQVAAAELVEVVDEDGRVLDVVSRQKMRANNLLHRCTYVAVMVGPVPDAPIDSADLTATTGLWVHKRADWKDTSPSYWDLAFGGVCGVGEDWLVSAERELAEEAGIFAAVLTDLGPCRYEDATTRVLGRIFLTAWPSEPSCPDGEVVAIARTTLGDLAQWATALPVCADSAAVVIPALGDMVRRTC